MVSDTDIRFVARDCNLDNGQLHDLYGALGLKKAAIHAALYNKTALGVHDFKLQAIDVLSDCWKQVKADKATRMALIKALQACGYNEQVKMVTQKWGISLEGTCCYCLRLVVMNGVLNAFLYIQQYVPKGKRKLYARIVCTKIIFIFIWHFLEKKFAESAWSLTNFNGFNPVIVYNCGCCRVPSPISNNLRLEYVILQHCTEVQTVTKKYIYNQKIVFLKTFSG